MADDDLKAELERLRAENDRLKKRPERTTSLKVSEKGGVSVYGLGRFPVTLYKEQWAKLLDLPTRSEINTLAQRLRLLETQLRSAASAAQTAPRKAAAARAARPRRKPARRKAKR